MFPSTQPSGFDKECFIHYAERVVKRINEETPTEDMSDLFRPNANLCSPRRFMFKKSNKENDSFSMQLFEERIQKITGVINPEEAIAEIGLLVNKINEKYSETLGIAKGPVLEVLNIQKSICTSAIPLRKEADKEELKLEIFSAYFILCAVLVVGALILFPATMAAYGVFLEALNSLRFWLLEILFVLASFETISMFLETIRRNPYEELKGELLSLQAKAKKQIHGATAEALQELQALHTPEN